MSAFKAWLTGCALLEGGGALRWGPGEGVRALVCVLQRVIGSHPSPSLLPGCPGGEQPCLALCSHCDVLPHPRSRYSETKQPRAETSETWRRPSSHELKPLKPWGQNQPFLCSFPPQALVAATGNRWMGIFREQFSVLFCHFFNF